MERGFKGAAVNFFLLGNKKKIYVLFVFIVGVWRLAASWQHSTGSLFTLEALK